MTVYVNVPLVEITVRGPVDLDNGMVVNMTDLKEVIKEAVLDPLDHKNLASGLSSRERECV